MRYLIKLIEKMEKGKCLFRASVVRKSLWMKTECVNNLKMTSLTYNYKVNMPN